MNIEVRIRYKCGQQNANIDKAIFNRWEERLITTSQACLELEQSVGHSISKSQFVINANWLGYHRKIGKNKLKKIKIFIKLLKKERERKKRNQHVNVND